ncbi:MAG: peptidoglycan editing factor PgeF [Parvibaculum sp.]|nr:peptidoglycan editing factor PgeF [Parvibaculum sp.]
MLTAKPLDVLSHIRHGFFTREGGVSKGIYASLNCGYGSDDATENVRENRARVAEKLSVEREKLLTVYQIHSPDVVAVTEPWTPDTAPQADAMVTATPGIALGILTADCAPVLFADKKARVIGAAHAGWKGALGGVLEATVEAMIRLGAERQDIAAAIGPCISQDAYEVGPEFRARFIEADEANARWFEPSDKDRHGMFDLPGYVEARLEAADIGTVSVLGQCTYQDEKRFFSFRRTTHRGEKDYGRQISALMLRP